MLFILLGLLKKSELNPAMAQKLSSGLRQLTLEIVHVAPNFYASQRSQSPLHSQWKELQSQAPEADVNPPPH